MKCRASQFVKKTSAEMNLLKLRRGNSREQPPARMGSNAPETLLYKDSGKRRANFSAAVGRKSNGIFPVYASARISPAIRSPSSAPRPKST